MNIKKFFDRFRKQPAIQIEQVSMIDLIKNGVVSLDQIFEKNNFYNKAPISQPAKNSYLIYKCVQCIADRIPKVPIKFYRKADDEQVYDDVNEAAIFLLSPGEHTFFEFMSKSLMFYALYGESFWVWQDSVGSLIGSGKPMAIDVVDPMAMTEDLTSSFDLKGWVYSGMYKNNEIKNYLPKEKVIQVHNSNPYNMWRGLRAIDAIANELGIDYKSAQEMVRFYDNFAIPGTILTAPADSPITREDMQAYIKQFDSRHKGVEDRFRTAGFSGGITAQTLGVTADKQQLIEIKNFIRDTVLAVMNVPLTYAGYTEGINRATADAQERNFWQYAESLLYRFQCTINSKIINRIDPTIECRFDFSDIDALRPDMAAEVTIATQLLNMGYSPDDLNERYSWDLPFNPGITDCHYKPFNLELIGVAGKPYEAPEPEPAPITPPEKEKEKETFKIEDKLSFDQTRKEHLKVQGLQERKVGNNLRNYFKLQRSKVLKQLAKFDNSMKLQDVMSKQDIYMLIAQLSNIFRSEDTRLKSRLEPLYTETTLKGQEFALFMMNIDRDVILNTKIVKERLNLVKGMNDTTFNQLKKTIFDAVNAGESIDTMASKIKDVYNYTDTRATLIARTETNNIISQASLEEYKANGVSKKQWLTAGDSKVRASCNQAASDGAIPVDQRFSNGHDHPTEFNCRCCISPLVT